jgi:hypothetical protein
MRITAAAILLTGEASAGAWTQPAGDAFVSMGVSRYESGDYAETTVTTYGEIGITDWLTGALAVEGDLPDGSDAIETGYSGFLRARLWTGPAGDPLSAQVGWIGDGGDVADLGAPQIAREDEVDARLLYGRGFDSALGPGWLNVEAGYRWRLDISADELRLDATVGLRPWEDWLVMLQSFNTVGLRNNAPFGGDYDAFKLAPSVGYALSARATVVLGVEREIAGRNIDYGTRLRVSLWLDF